MYKSLQFLDLFCFVVASYFIVPVFNLVLNRIATILGTAKLVLNQFFSAYCDRDLKVRPNTSPLLSNFGIFQTVSISTLDR